MTIVRQVALAAILACCGTVHAHAASYRFRYETIDQFQSAPIEASGTLEAVHDFGSFFNITSILGSINGFSITGFDNTHFHSFSGGVDNDRESIKLFASDGNFYDFNYTWADRNGLPDTTVLGKFTVSSVPLPASAPMFGAALLGLAMFGHAIKGKKAAADV